MKILKQFGVIFGVCWVSLVIEHYLPFSFPASVIGMILLLLCLLTGFLKIEHVQEKADFLLGNMAFFFVPAGVSIINYFDILKSTVLQLLVICVVSTIVTFAVTAYAVTLTVKLMEKKKGGKILDVIETVGNKLPHPYIMFLWLCLILAGISTVCSLAGVQVINPTTGETVLAKAIFSRDGIVWLLENLLKNFQGFSALGLVLAMQMAIGFAEGVGLLTAAMRKAILGVPLWALTATVELMEVLLRRQQSLLFRHWQPQHSRRLECTRSQDFWLVMRQQMQDSQPA